MNTALEYSTRVVQEGDRRCKKSTLNDLAYLTPLRIPLMNPVRVIFTNIYRAGSLGFSMDNLFGFFKEGSGHEPNTRNYKDIKP